MKSADQLELLLHWLRNAKRAGYAHYRMANKYHHKYKFIGITITLITVICGSSVIADLSNYFPSAEVHIKMIIGLALLFASALSAMQTQLKLDEKARLHKDTGAAYNAVKRQIDQMLVAAKDGLINAEALNNVREKIDNLGANSPQPTDRIWRKATKKMPTLEFKHYQVDKYIPKS